MKRILEILGRPTAALAIALLLGAVVIACTQRSISAPFEAYRALFVGAAGSGEAWANTLWRTTPLLLTGAAVVVALAAGLFNIGAEGQLAVGGLAAAYIGFTLRALPAPILLLLALAAGMAAGSLWAFLPGFLKVKRGAHEVITAILLNYCALYVTHYLATYPLKDAGAVPQTPEVGATLPLLFAAYRVHTGLFVALAAVILIALALRRTVWGYETRAVGLGAGAAEAAGIRAGRVQINAMLVSGALAGLAGAVLVLGATPFRRFPADFYGAGYGFDGLAVALLAGGSAWGVLPAALLFALLGEGGGAMEMETETKKQIVMVVQAILIALVAARFTLRFPRVKGKA